MAHSEVEVWWGSYAGRAMAPSFAVCIALTALIYGGVRWFVPERGWLQFTFFGLASAVWLVQLARWAKRFFTWNYRLTTHFLYVDCGLKRSLCRRFALPPIDRVEVRHTALQKWLGIGDLWVWFGTAKNPPTILKAVKHPYTVA